MVGRTALPNGQGLQGETVKEQVRDAGLEGGLMVTLEPLERAVVTMSATVLRRFCLVAVGTTEKCVGCVVTGTSDASVAIASNWGVEEF